MDDDEFGTELRKQHRKDSRTKEYRAYVSQMRVKRNYRCEWCGRRGVPPGVPGRGLTIHHKDYIPGLRLWEYPDDMVLLVHVGRCHREADCQREKEASEAAEYNKLLATDDVSAIQSFHRFPNFHEQFSVHGDQLRQLQRYEVPFKQWLIDKGIVPEDWDWDNYMSPLPYLWNENCAEFFRDLKPPEEPRQLGLGL